MLAEGMTENAFLNIKNNSKNILAEIELSALKGQCLDRRIAEIVIWENNRNNSSKTIDWQFSTSDARIKLKRLYPNL